MALRQWVPNSPSPKTLTGRVPATTGNPSPRMSTPRLASDASLDSRWETVCPTAGCNAGSAVGQVLQQTVGASGESSAGTRRTTARMTDASRKPLHASITSQEKTGIVPRFLVVKRIDEGNFDKVSPFVISKHLFGLVGNLKNIKKVKEGLLVETVSEAQARRLLQIQKLNIYNVTVEPHKSLNHSRGVVVCPDLLNCSIEEILCEMESEGVIGVRRIKKRVNGELVDTSNHILTFNRPKLPVKVKIAFYSLDVRPYIPNPLRCFNCQKFGHTTNFCTDTKICACGKPPHDGEICQDPVKCINCEGPHSAKSRKCPKMIEETNIQKVKVLENLSYAEARRKVRGSKTNLTTYAQVTNTNMNDTILQLIPNITKIIESQIKSAFNALTRQETDSVLQQRASSSRDSTVMNPPKYIPKETILRKSGSISDASQATTSEKRKRTEATYRLDDSADSDESLLSSQASDTSKTNKKRKGWPKGKPRKPQDGQGNLAQIPHPPD